MVRGLWQRQGDSGSGEGMVVRIEVVRVEVVRVEVEKVVVMVRSGGDCSRDLRN